ncbi:hypothetical protein [Streptococcus sp. E24BD]|uniref:hypothetical protein n=1 Tax=Streptococcus sp. E24BD TaxID=3278715 RepID=UPI00359E17EC
MKKLIKTLVAMSLLGLSLAGIVEAKQIGYFHRFTITRDYARTYYVQKDHANYPYIQNLEDSAGMGIRVRHRLVNSNGEARSHEYLTWCGDRTEHGNWATAGYIYALDMSRENRIDGPAYITGSWSPN